MVGWCVANRRARITLDVGADAVRFNNPLLPESRSELALPLISRGQALGALTIQSAQESAFSSEDIETFQTLADQLANAILNARLYDQLEKELDERKRAEAQVRQLNTELEERVAHRTLALKASEETFRALSENNPLRIRRYDRDGRVLYANAVSSTPNFKPEDIIGKTIDEFIEDETLAEFAKGCIRQVFDTGQPMNTEYKIKASFASWWLAPEFGPNGKVISVITTAMDITERRHMEDKLRARTLELQATNRELESFSYSVSHDLRAPLRALDGFSRILLDDYQEALPADARPHLNRIREAAKQMAQLIDDMLRLSRVTRAEMHSEPVDLSGIANQIIEGLKNREPGRIITVKIHENLTARGDEGLLRMALENLLNNAWKFSAKTNQPEIEVGKVNLQDKETFFIRDNGVGFDMAYADKLFSAFQRLHSPQDFPGTGIGLAIVQRVIHRHGGKIWAESEPGQGATFYFML
jgi:PAS domain S-box-containing protein